MRSREKDLSLGRRTVVTFSSSRAQTNDRSSFRFALFPACAAVPAQRNARAADVADSVSICRVLNWHCKGDCTFGVSTPQLRPNDPVVEVLLEVAHDAGHSMWLMESQFSRHCNLRTKPNGGPILLPSCHRYLTTGLALSRAYAADHNANSWLVVPSRPVFPIQTKSRMRPRVSIFSTCQIGPGSSGCLCPRLHVFI